MPGDHSSQPRVAYVTGTYPELSETFVTGELLELGRRGVDTVVFAVVRGHGPLNGAPPATYVVELAKPVQVASMLGLAARHPMRTARALFDPQRRWGGSARDMAALAPMAWAMRGFDHVHAHFAGQPTDVAARLSELTGVPFSFTAHAHDVFVEWQRMHSKLGAARFAATVCEYNRDYIVERVPGARLDLVICGVDTEEFVRSRPYDPKGPVVAVGRLVEQKGFEHLVRAVASAGERIPEVMIVGDGPLRGRLEALVRELDAPVRMLGVRSHDQVRELYESASMAVLPCVVAADGNRDSMPVSLKEAMALELPVVGTDEVGLPELIGTDRGRLVPPGDVEALAGALVEIAEMPERERVALGRAGRAFVQEHCNLRTETGKLLELFAGGG